MLENIQPALCSRFADLALHAKRRAGATEARWQLLAMSATLSGSNEMHMCKVYQSQLKGIPRRRRRSARFYRPTCTRAGGARCSAWRATCTW